MIILDGGLGRELKAMGAPFRQPEWSALALMEGPDFVNHPADKSGESTASGISFFFKNDDTILLDCIDWSEKLPYTDNFTLNIRTKEFNYWLPN